MAYDEKDFNRALGKVIKWLVVWMVILFVLALLASCRQVEYVTVEKVRTDTTYITKWQKYCIPYEGNENLIGTKNAAAKIFISDWREKCCDQCKYKFVEYKGKQQQCGFSKCTDEEVAEFNEHHGCQGIREYLKTGVFPERGRK